MRPIILLVLALLLGGVQQAAACKCAQDPDAPPEGSEAWIAADLAGSTVVFTGRVARMQSRIRLAFIIPRYLFLARGGRDLTDEEADKLFRRRVQLKVKESFKGTAVHKVVLYTGWGGGDCGYGFQRGSRYLVYANASDNGLYTGICHATKRIEAAGAEIVILRQLARLESGDPRKGH